MENCWFALIFPLFPLLHLWQPTQVVIIPWSWFLHSRLEGPLRGPRAGSAVACRSHLAFPTSLHSSQGHGLAVLHLLGLVPSCLLYQPSIYVHRMGSTVWIERMNVSVCVAVICSRMRNRVVRPWAYHPTIITDLKYSNTPQQSQRQKQAQTRLKILNVYIPQLGGGGNLWLS